MGCAPGTIIAFFTRPGTAGGNQPRHVTVPTSRTRLATCWGSTWCIEREKSFIFFNVWDRLIKSENTMIAYIYFDISTNLWWSRILYLGWPERFSRETDRRGIWFETHTSPPSNSTDLRTYYRTRLCCIWNEDSCRTNRSDGRSVFPYQTPNKNASSTHRSHSRCCNQINLSLTTFQIEYCRGTQKEWMF